MSKTKKCMFTIEEKNRTQNKDWSGGDLSRRLYTKEFKGEIEGTAILEAVMLQLEGGDGVMAYVGVERISCTLDGRTGTFVMVHNAEAAGKNRNATWKILPGSGTGDLVGISGHGIISPKHEFTLAYELPSDPT